MGSSWDKERNPKTVSKAADQRPKEIRKKTRNSIVYSLRCQELGLRLNKRALFESSLSSRDRKFYTEVCHNMKILQGYCEKKDVRPQDVIQAVKHIIDSLLLQESPTNHLYQAVLLDFHGYQTIRSLILYPKGGKPGKPLQFEANISHQYEEVRLVSLECYRELINLDSEFLEAVVSLDGELIESIFLMMEYVTDPDLHCALLQEILTAREETYELLNISNFSTIIAKVENKGFMCICRLLSLLIYEAEDQFPIELIKSSPKGSLPPKKSKFSNSFRIIDRNQAYLVNRTETVARLIKILDYISTKPMQKIPPSLILVLQGQHDRMVDVLNEAPDASIDSLVQSFIEMNSFVDCFFTLSTLLSGKRTGDLQVCCAALGFVPKMQSIVQMLDWESSHSHDHGETQLHGPGCECNIESTMNTQVLRLIHSFCDRDLTHGSNKKLLFSAQELRIMGIDLPPNHESVGSRGEIGLITTIADLLVRLPENSVYRFWLSSCIEAFLRNSRPEYQLFLIKRGLMHYILRSVVCKGSLGGESLQTSFDLLSELVKFNPEGIKLVANYFSQGEFERFVEAIVENLVDSNVFLRALILTDVSAPKMEKMRDESMLLEDSKVIEFYHRNRLRLLYNLMNAVTVETISQENICCLNTAMIIIIASIRRQEGAQLLLTIHRMDETNKTPGKTLSNFLDLIDFWSKYYSKQSRDGVSLEMSSRISIREWQLSRRFVASTIREILADSSESC